MRHLPFSWKGWALPRALLIASHLSSLGLRELTEQPDDFRIPRDPLTVLSEEVTVNNLNQAVELLDSQQARRNIQDEFREHFATRRNASDIVQKHSQPQHPMLSQGGAESSG